MRKRTDPRVVLCFYDYSSVAFCFFRRRRGILFFFFKRKSFCLYGGSQPQRHPNSRGPHNLRLSQEDQETDFEVLQETMSEEGETSDSEPDAAAKPKRRRPANRPCLRRRRRIARVFLLRAVPWAVASQSGAPFAACAALVMELQGPTSRPCMRLNQWLRLSICVYIDVYM